jgi:hypothetical protein
MSLYLALPQFVGEAADFRLHRLGFGGLAGTPSRLHLGIGQGAITKGFTGH